MHHLWHLSANIAGILKLVEASKMLQSHRHPQVAVKDSSIVNSKAHVGPAMTRAGDDDKRG